MKNKIIILVSVMLMMFTLVACGEKSDEQGGQGGAEGNNEYVIINDKTYDLSKSCGEILQDLMEDGSVINSNMDSCYDSSKPIRKSEHEDIWNEEIGVYIPEYHYYQLDENGEYVEMKQEDFDNRVVLMLSEKMGNTLQPELGDLTTIGITPFLPLNNPNFQITTPGGIQIGSTVEEIENAGGYKNNLQYYEMIYVDGKLVKPEDYREEAERIQQMEDSEWKQEIQREYRYGSLVKEYIGSLNKVEDKDLVMYLLANADAYSKIYTENKDTVIKFTYLVEDGKVQKISFNVIRKNVFGQNAYEKFMNDNQ